ncbi:high-potential iron-sulfur protein [Variovorax sp. Root434]|uniref:high-potential iron-sulfur protein n=1 Tax=unclassified Variovorax TaxID=663243 RepID=UPI0006FF13C1|nr:high-potential iron-sulfur protein [Variovorax sp. Root434]KQX35480.1 iron permease [Variovorax sp. Root434]
MKSNRRIFMLTIAATGAAASVTGAFAQARLDEKDPQAAALGYVADSAKADAKKFPKHDNAQLCNGCALWQSKPADAQGNCALFAGKQVNAKGWCSAWAKKA